MARSSAKVRKDTPYPLDKIFIQVHRSAAGVLWWFRTEMAACLVATAGMWELDKAVAATWTVIILATPMTVITVLPPIRQQVIRRVFRTLSRHRIHRVCFETRMHTRSGRLPLVLRIFPTEVGERAVIWCRAGICAEDFELNAAEIAAACYARQARIEAHLDYWLENIVRPSRRAATYALYEGVIRLYLKPGLGHYWLRRLSVPIVQSFLNAKLAEGKSIRNVHIMREVLSAALTRAVREELIGRNVARLTDLPGRESRDIRPWSADEAIEFLRVAKPDPLYPAFVLLILYGMRRDEVLGLRWQDVDLDGGTFAIRQQLQRVHGSLRTGPVKTRAGNRDLPIPGLAREALLMRQQKQAADREAFGRAWQDTGLVFTTRSGLPIEPRNLVRSFRRICDHNQIRVIKVHHLRHTTASLLKKLRVPPRDAQMILGHAHISTTMQIYTHVDQEARDDAVASLNKLLGGGQ